MSVPDEHDTLEGAAHDEEKISKILSKLGVDSVSGTHRRLGNNTTLGTRRRPILFTLADEGQRSTILDNANRLKTSGDNYNKIYAKKDVHPCVRREWRRLRAETTEKAPPENAGCAVLLDTREGKLYRDADVIDSWNLQFFLTSPQHTRKIRSMSWNTGGVPTELEKADVQQMLHDYDIVCINEVKLFT